MNWRVRYRLGIDTSYPWAVEYRKWWWPFWSREGTYYNEKQAITRAQEFSTKKLITKIP